MDVERPFQLPEGRIICEIGGQLRTNREPSLTIAEVTAEAIQPPDGVGRQSLGTRRRRFLREPRHQVAKGLPLVGTGERSVGPGYWPLGVSARQPAMGLGCPPPEEGRAGEGRVRRSRGTAAQPQPAGQLLPPLAVAAGPNAVRRRIGRRSRGDEVGREVRGVVRRKAEVGAVRAGGRPFLGWCKYSASQATVRFEPRSPPGPSARTARRARRADRPGCGSPGSPPNGRGVSPFRGLPRSGPS